MNKNELTFEMVRKAYDNKGYKFFEGDYSSNLFGIRSKDPVPNLWNDLLCLAQYESGILNEGVLHTHYGTTKPGLYYLKKKMGNINGTAILIPGQYRSCWTIGAHKGRYSALVQKGSPFRVWRDNNSDGQFDYSGVVYTDVTGLNMHTESLLRDTSWVGAYSAGCMVREFDKEHFEIMTILMQSASKYGNSFSFTLFTEDEVFGL